MADSSQTRKSSHEAERDVEAARKNLVGSINELEARIGPDALVDQGVAYLRGNGRRHMGSVMRSVEANPLALVLIGIGVAWLAFGSRSNQASEQMDQPVPYDRDHKPEAGRPAATSVQPESRTRENTTVGSLPRDQSVEPNPVSNTGAASQNGLHNPSRSSGISADSTPVSSGVKLVANTSDAKKEVEPMSAASAGLNNSRETTSFREPLVRPDDKQGDKTKT